jgi:Sap, sulfolipid-1-addressing protein
MWGTVLLMAAVVAIDPAQVGGVAYILSRERALRLLLAYFIGGFGVSLIAGAVVIFVLDGVGVGQGSSIPPEIEIGVGAVALVFAALVGAGIADRVRDRAKSKRASDQDAETLEGAGEGGPSLEKLPGYDKLPHRLRDALDNDSPWLAWAYGVAFGIPSAYYLAAIAAILKSGAETPTQIAALLVFSLVAFAVAEIPLVSFAVAPEATRMRVNELYAWVSTHQRLVVTILASVVGVYLIAIGISKL